jgi:hypothetical protein
MANLKPSKITLQMWNGSKLTSLGEYEADIANPKARKRTMQSVTVVEENLRPLLGLPAMEALNLVSLDYDGFVHSVDSELLNLFDIYAVFYASLGCLPGVTKLTINEAASPVVSPPRRVSFSIKDCL